MRCPECGYNQRVKLGMDCVRCRYRFALNPKEPPYAADRRFRNAIDRVSAGGERSYTAGQLHAVMFRRRNRGIWRRWFLAAGTSRPEATADAIKAWRRARKDLGPIILRPGFESAASASPEWPESDLYQYGAEGVLVVDDWVLVDLLVALGVHTTTKVAVVGAPHGYPEPVAARLRSTIAARSDLPIFLLHASRGDEYSAGLESTARRLLGAPDNPVVDLGLGPDAMKRLKPLRWARKMPSVPADMLPHRWLTSGLAAAIAHRVSLDELVHPPPAEDGVGTVVLWSGDDDGDGDFG